MDKTEQNEDRDPENLDTILARMGEKFFNGHSLTTHAAVVSAVPQGRQSTEPKDVVKRRAIIRPELNIERYASIIFSTNNAKDLNKERSKSWVVTDGNGKKSQAAITVQPYKEKRPTVTTHKVFLALVKIFEEKGWDANERTVTSLKEIMDTLGWQNGGKRLNMVSREMYQLRFTPFILKNSFEDAQGNSIKYIDLFTILDDAKMVIKEVREKSEQFQSLVSFRFHELIRNRLKNNKTKPTNFDVLVSGIRGEFAHILYTKLDPILAEASPYQPYQCRSKKLFEELQIEGEKYRTARGRNQQLAKAAKELDGKALSTGIIRCNTQKTTDGSDYKLVAWRVPFTEGKNPLSSANQTEDIPHIIKEIQQTLGVADRRRYDFLARRFPMHPVIYQALREYKADAPTDHHPLRYFQTVLHRIAHQHGYEWIRACGTGCKYRSQTT